MSIFIPISVFISDNPSAPPASAAFAISVIEVTFGESFTTSGFFECFLTALVSSFTTLGSVPNAKPPCFTLGQEIFISMIATSVSERISAISQYSSIVLPDIFAITFVSYSASIGIMCFAKCSTPGF